MDNKNIKPQYVGDDKISVRLAGLAWVSKQDRVFVTGSNSKYFLQFQYKGMSKEIEYDNAHDRDIMYDLVTEYLSIVKTG